MKNKKKRNKLMLLLVLLLAISIGFAALATTLKINGTTNISKNTWDVYWEKKAVNPDGVSQAEPTLSAETGKTALTIATWGVTLNAPGDFYEFTINAVNNGTLDAMVGVDGVVTTYEANNENTPSTLPEYIVYSVTYEDGTAISPYHLLAKKNGNTPTKEAYKVRIEFTDDITPAQMNAIPEGGYSYTFDTQAQYVQADSNAIDLHPVNPYLTSFDGNYEYTTTCQYEYSSESETPFVPIDFSSEWDTYLRNDGNITETCGVFLNGTVCLTSSNYNSNYSTAGSYAGDFEDCSSLGFYNVTYDGTGSTCVKGYAKVKADEMLSKGATECGVSKDSIWCYSDDENSYGSCAIDADGGVKCDDRYYDHCDIDFMESGIGCTCQ